MMERCELEEKTYELKNSRSEDEQANFQKKKK